MDKLISAEKLYNKVAELEELARDRVLDTPTTSPAHPRYVAQLNERTALKHMIMDEPAAFDKEKVIRELQKMKDVPHDDSVAEIVSTQIWNKALQKAIKIVEKGGIE